MSAEVRKAVIHERWNVITTDVEEDGEGGYGVTNSDRIVTYMTTVRELAARMIGETLNEEERSALDGVENDALEFLGQRLERFAIEIEEARDKRQAVAA